MTGGSVSKTKLKLYLINPRQKYKHYSTQVGTTILLGKKSTLAPLSLAILASLTPDHYDIKIIDEEVEPVPFDDKPDLVGITGLSNTINRGFEIADHFRNKNIPVIFGGPHCTGNFEELSEHADSIVSGEAEDLWLNILEDFENDKLKAFYKSTEPIDVKKLPLPRWDLINSENYLSLPVQASRGCPYSCEFCLVSKMFGRKKRFRNIDNIIEEIKALPVKRILFADDNLTINRKFALELTRRMKDLNVSWICQSSIEISKDDELLSAMADAGCEQILIGFESLNNKSLEETNKEHNRRYDFGEAVDNISKHGIFVLASFVIGFDNDTLTELDRIRQFTEKHGIFYVALNILGYSQGTDLYDRLLSENRIPPVEKDFRGGMFPVINYKNINEVDLFTKYLDTISEIFKYSSLQQKSKKLFRSGNFNRFINYKDVPPKEKSRISFLLLRKYLLTSDSSKRKFFLHLLSYYFRRKMPMERIIVILLSMHGFNSYISSLKDQKDYFISKIKLYYN